MKARENSQVVLINLHVSLKGKKCCLKKAYTLLLKVSKCDVDKRKQTKQGKDGNDFQLFDTTELLMSLTEVLEECKS